MSRSDSLTHVIFNSFTGTGHVPRMEGVDISMNDLDQLALTEDFQREHPNIVPSLNSIRWMIRHRHQNGLSEAKAVVKRGGRWYVHSGRFSAWMVD